MVSGVQQIACPGCGRACLPAVATPGDVNPFSHCSNWTDGAVLVHDADPLGTQPLTYCDRCPAWFWTADARPVPLDAIDWAAFGSARWLTEDDCFRLLRVSRPGTRGWWQRLSSFGHRPSPDAGTDRLTQLRLLAWQRGNDPSRAGRPHPTTDRPAGTPTRHPGWRTNLEQLIEVLDARNLEERLLQAEAWRHLGEFARGLALAEPTTDRWLRHRAKVIADLCRQGRIDVCVVHGNEARTPEDDEADHREAEARREEDRAYREREAAARAAWEAKAPRLRAEVEAERAAKENAGKLCPKCGFGYGWNGQRCTHCGHPPG